MRPPRADTDELALDPLRSGLGDAAERRTLHAGAVGELDVRLLEPPAVDGHRLLDDVDQAEGTHLVRDEVHGLALLGRPGHPEPERVRTDRGQPLDDVRQVLGRELHGRPSSSPSSVSRTSAPIACRS